MDLFDFQRSKISEKIKESVFSVSEYLSLLNDILVYQRAKVKGEIGKVDERRKWVYFTLKDKDGATMNCLIFKDVLTKKGFSLKEGQEAEVFGFPEIYKPQGKLTFRVDDILLKGEGILKESFLRLKEKLKKEIQSNLKLILLKFFYSSNPPTRNVKTPTKIKNGPNPPSKTTKNFSQKFQISQIPKIPIKIPAKIRG